MKKMVFLTVLMSMLVGAVFISTIDAQAPVSNAVGFPQTVDLAGEHAQAIQYFVMESKLVTYALNGTRLSTDRYTLRL